MADEELVRRARTGDQAAFGALASRHSRAAYGIALRMTRRPEDAEDLAQEALVRAYRGLCSFRGSSTFRTWLFRITVNLTLNYLRRAEREVAVEDHETWPAQGPQSLETMERDEQMTLLAGAMAKLPPKQRAVVELRVQEGLAFKEIAGIVGCSVATAKVHYFHASQTLRRLIAKETEVRR